jgi:WD40 repeat protein
MIRWWDLETQGYLGSLPGHLLGVTRLDLPDFGNFLASGSDDATVRVWDVSTAFNQGVDAVRLLFTFRDPVARVVDLDASPNGEMLAAASQRNVHVWHPQTGVLLKKISQPEGWYSAVTFSPDSQVLATAFDGRRLEFWNTFTWQRVKFIRLSTPVQVLAYSPDGIYLAVGYTDGRIQIWDARNKFLRVDLAGHEGLTSLTFDSVGTRLVTSSADGTIRVWDVSPLYGVD